jgi:hypothetical protein
MTKRGEDLASTRGDSSQPEDKEAKYIGMK